MKAEEMVMLIYPTGLLILFVPITSFIEKGFFHEFWLRLLAERRREKLQEELSRIEQLNTKLEETKESLEREIEERKQVENRLEYLAAYDELTGVYNRRAGIELLKHSLEVARRRGNAVTVAFVDVDQLKSVNDNLGHDAGDRYLLEVVSVLRKFLRKSDVVIRYGGDEFVVILDECTEAEAEETFERIEWEMVHRRSEEGLFAVSFSYGFAEAGPGESWTYQQLLTAADKKMYIQKQRKRQG
jgi:diguanylate cyclase (GGDEF)-like protein